MQFSVLAVFATLASFAAATSTVTVYACAPSGVASPTVASASTGAVVAPTSTYSPITYATGAASLNKASALGMIIAGGVALLL